MRGAFNGSPSATTPTTNAPMAPMPVQTVYAVPSGMLRMAIDNSAKLGKSAPDTSAKDDAAAKVDYLVLVGDRP